MTKTKKLLAVLCAFVFAIALTACGEGNKKESSSTASGSTSESVAASTESKASSEEKKGEGKTEAKGEINVVSREEGSGTRGAFTEITKVAEGKEDKTFQGATIVNSTNAVTTYVAKDKNSIGYISLGSLNDTVKAAKVEGVEATEENVVNGSYKVKRPFNIAYKEDKLDATGKDFINYIMSKEGQALAKESDVIAMDANAKPYAKSGDVKGKISIQGSTSVTPYMEKLMEAYKKVQPGVEFNFTSNGSGAGIKAVISGEAMIGMASREVKDEEKKEGVTPKQIATDGIAIIVHKENACNDLTLEQIKNIFTGSVRDWGELK